MHISNTHINAGIRTAVSELIKTRMHFTYQQWQNGFTVLIYGIMAAFFASFVVMVYVAVHSNRLYYYLLNHKYERWLELFSFLGILTVGHPIRFIQYIYGSLDDDDEYVRNRRAAIRGGQKYAVYCLAVCVLLIIVIFVLGQNGKGTETFTFKIDNGKAYLLGYNIDSRELIMK